ncbi:MAG: insulinase family protein [Thermoanaerobaculia bacterium]|nr:insulinase family protein [Thermoanaerobaculia bacterium]
MKPTSLRRLLWLALAVFGLACATGRPPQPSVPATTAPAAPVSVSTPAALDLATAPHEALLPSDPAVRTGQLANGLRYYIRANQRPEKRAELRLIVNAGSLLEDDDQRGLAHFVEHMAFNGTQALPKHELVDYLQSIGMRFGADLNAYTNFDETVYMLKVPSDDPALVEKGIFVLREWAHAITFEDEEIEKERGVVVEEWRLGRGAGGRLIDQLFPILFRGSRYAERLPIGTRETLENASPEALRRFYRDWYRPDLMAVVAVGDFDVDVIERQIRERFGTLENPPGGARARSTPCRSTPRRFLVSSPTPSCPTPRSRSITNSPNVPRAGSATTAARWSKVFTRRCSTPASPRSRSGPIRPSFMPGPARAASSARSRSTPRRRPCPRAAPSAGCGRC